MAQSLPKTAAVFETTLAAQVVAGDASVTLTSVLDADGNTLAAGLYGFTIDGDVENSREYIIGTLSGSTVSGILSISTQNASTSGIAKYHRRGASIAITDWVALGRIGAVARGDSGFDATAPLFYDAAPTFSTGNQIVTKTYVDSVVAGGTVSFNNQIFASQIAGENLTANDHVYFKESDQRWYKVDADLTATYQQVKRGYAVATQTTGGTLQIYNTGLVGGFLGLTPGSKYYASNTAGAISTIPGTNTVYAGTAFSATQLIVDFTVRDIPYANEKDALAGSLGTPSSSNTYITALNRSSGGTDQSQTTQNSSSAVGTADTTGLRNRLAQSFIPAKTKMRGVSLYKSADTGTFTGTVTVALQADTAGSPSGSDLATVTITNTQWLEIATGEFSAIFTTEYTSLTIGSTYWIVISTSTASTANCPNVGINTAGGYGSGSAKYNNTTDGWVAIATIDLYFKTLEGNTNQVVSAGSDGYIAPSFVPQLIATDSTANTIVDGNGAAEKAIFQKSIPASLLGTRNVLRGKVWVTAAVSSSGQTLTFRLKYGATTLVTTAVSNSVDTSGTGFLEFTIVANNSTSAQIGAMQAVLSASTVEESGRATVGISKIMISDTGTATENSATALDVTVTAQYSGTSGTNDLTAIFGYVEVIRQ